MGPSGSGKSTLLHLLGALDTPSSGEIQLAGQRYDGLGDGELTRLRREKIGFVFQFFNLLPSLSAEENVLLPALIAGRRDDEMRRRARELLGRVGLAERAGHLPAELSGGEQQRVSIARALLTEPEIVLADEPTGNLDTRSSGEVLRLLRELNESEGQTLVIVSHDPAAASTARRVVFLRDGRLAGRGRGGLHGPRGHRPWPSWTPPSLDALLRLPGVSAAARKAAALPADHRRDRAGRGDDPRRPAAHGHHPPHLQRPLRLCLRANRSGRLRRRRRRRSPLRARRGQAHTRRRPGGGSGVQRLHPRRSLRGGLDRRRPAAERRRQSVRAASSPTRARSRGADHSAGWRSTSSAAGPTPTGSSSATACAWRPPRASSDRVWWACSSSRADWTSAGRASPRCRSARRAG